jgi:YegS/Rv2252/BmrU family lipid kinase
MRALCDTCVALERQTPPVTVIINPIAGGAGPEGGRRRGERALAILSKLNARGDVLVTERRGHARELARAAIARGSQLIVAWGGDGTVNEVASSLAFGTVPLGIVPSGSGNGLARALAIDGRPERAIAAALAAAPAPRRIDAGEIDGRLFFSVAGVGFDAHVAACFDRDLSDRRRFTGYVRVAARELVTYRSRPYRITAHGEGHERKALLVTLANSSQFGNGARIAPGARVDDGQLDLVVVEESSRLRTIASLPALFSGRIDRVRGVSIQRVRSATIEGAPPLSFHVDGEALTGGGRLDASVHPAALAVAVR